MTLSNACPEVFDFWTRSNDIYCLIDSLQYVKYILFIFCTWSTLGLKQWTQQAINCPYLCQFFKNTVTFYNYIIHILILNGSKGLSCLWLTKSNFCILQFALQISLGRILLSILSIQQTRNQIKIIHVC